MSSDSRDEQHIPQRSGSESRVKYVEELAHADDVWVSITDAARITRTSEAMARRWVTSGRLPVKRQPVGINQHTRLVRLSDVEAIRPIIDPTAAISDEIHRLDLPSIPRQQVQIMQDHERLLHQVQEGQHAVDTLRTDLQEMATKQQQEMEELRHQLWVSQGELQGVLKRQQQGQEVLATQVGDQAQRIEQGANALTAHKRQQQQDLEYLRTSLISQLKEVRVETERTLDALDLEYRGQSEQVRREVAALHHQQEEQGQHLLLGLTELHQALVRHREEVTTLVEQQVHAIKTSLEQQSLEQSQEVVALRTCLEQVAQRLEQVAAATDTIATALQAYQQRANLQEQVMTTLTELLQEERRARKALTEHLATQQEQMLSLRREIDGLQSGKREL